MEVSKTPPKDDETPTIPRPELNTEKIAKDIRSPKLPICIWHKGCLDGFTSAWVVNQFFDGKVEFHPGVYQEEPPDVTDRNVLMVDFSYKKDVIEKMRETARAILILDHHKTAQADLEGYRPTADKVISFPYFPQKGEVAAFFDMDRSGAGLCWDFFFAGHPRPRFINHVEDRDLWRFTMQGTRQVNALAYTHDFDFDQWDRMIEECESNHGWAALVDQGEALTRQQRKNCERMIEDGKRMLTIKGTEMPVVNAPNFLASDIGNMLSETHDCKCGATFIVDHEGKQRFSLRSVEGGPDVSEIAKAMGGGGHAHAAGFTAPPEWRGE